MEDSRATGEILIGPKASDFKNLHLFGASSFFRPYLSTVFFSYQIYNIFVG